MIYPPLIAALLAVSAPRLAGAQAGATPPESGDPNPGTFENPSVHVRPKFRYWIPDASASHSVIASDVQAAGIAGAGGLECLGFYLYGGPPQYDYTTAPVSWATYGFGTEAWNSLFKAMVQATKDNDLIIDFAMGPNQGTGVPAPITSDGLMWDLVIYNATVPLGGSFDDVLPGWGTGPLEAAITGLVTNSSVAESIAPGLPGDYAEERTQYTLAQSSLEDVSSKVSPNGHLNVNFNSGQKQEGLYNTVFAIYLIHSHWRAQDGPADFAGQTIPARTIPQNGSWAVDHFSSLGAETMTNFWAEHILQNGTRELLMEVGSYGWEDSVEIQSNVFWTKYMKKNFSEDHGYSITKYLPTLFHRDGSGADSNPSSWWITDEPDNGLSHIADYRATLAKQYQQYLSTLSAWARDYLGLKFSAQVSYNLPMDMLANIPSVDVPECESLDFSDLIDGYRQYAGPAHLAGKLVISSECGAVPGRAYSQTLSEVLWKVKRSYAGSINQFVFHGFPYSGNYGNTTWPGYTTFNYKYSSMHGPRQPAWDQYRSSMDFVARGNFIMQSGTLHIDVAFWEKKVNFNGHLTARWYEPDDLELAGYTYEYLSPDNFDLPDAQVGNGVLAPNAQAFKALVVRANDSLTVQGATKLAQYARDGLPVIFSGGVPSAYLGTYGPGVVENAQKQLESTTALSNVHLTNSYDGLAETLASIGVYPSARFQSPTPSWYTCLRSDVGNGIDYYFVYNDAMYSPPGEGTSKAVVEFNSTWYPYVFDTWTGEQTPVLSYTQSNGLTIIPMALAGNQSTVIAFSKKPLTGPVPTTHLESVSDNVIGMSLLDNGTISLKTTGGSVTYKVAGGKDTAAHLPETQAITLGNWKLIAEHWDPPVNLSVIEGGTVTYNTTHALPHLVSWQQVPGLQNVSGRGFYSTSFQWPPSGLDSRKTQPDGAFIDFGPVLHTLSVWVNGHELPPLDVTSAKADITQWLVKGENTVKANIATTLNNVLRTIWDDLMTSGTRAADPVAGAPAPAIVDSGLIKDAIVQPYWSIQVD